MTCVTESCRKFASSKAAYEARAGHRTGFFRARAATRGEIGMPACFIVPHCFSLLSQPGPRAPGARFSRIPRGFHAQPCVPRIVNSLLLTMERTFRTARFFSRAVWKAGTGRSGSPDVKVPMEQRVRIITGGAPHPPGGRSRGRKSWLAAPAVVYKPVNLETLARTWA